MWSAEVLDPTVDVLVDSPVTAAPRSSLAVGTGRVALPLSERGLPVHGIELSEAMLRRLRGKPGAERVRTTQGDMTSARVEGRFTLVYLVFNTISNVTTQDGQVDVFQTAADHLEPGGHFLIEVGVPQLKAATRRAFPRFRQHRRLPGRGRVRRGHAGPVVAPPPLRRRPGHPVVDPVPLHLAGGARPDGPARRDAAGAPLGRLGPVAVQLREPLARVGVAQGLTGEGRVVRDVPVAISPARTTETSRTIRNLVRSCGRRRARGRAG